jgi:hypothetical protein
MISSVIGAFSSIENTILADLLPYVESTVLTESIVCEVL